MEGGGCCVSVSISLMLLPFGERRVLMRRERVVYGAPRIDRAVALEKRCLGSRLVKVEFVNGEKKVVRGVPRGMAVSTVRALVARWFGVEPLGVGLWLLVDGEEEGQHGEKERVALEDGVREVGYYVEGKEGTVLVGA